MGQPIIHQQKLLLLMPVNYSIAMRPNPQDPEQPKKAYAQVQTRDELTLKGLSKRISSQTTVSRADVSALLISAVENMVEALQADHVARGFADIGYHFYITRDGMIHRCRPVNPDRRACGRL